MVVIEIITFTSNKLSFLCIWIITSYSLKITKHILNICPSFIICYNITCKIYQLFYFPYSSFGIFIVFPITLFTHLSPITCSSIILCQPPTPIKGIPYTDSIFNHQQCFPIWLCCEIDSSLNSATL